MPLNLKPQHPTFIANANEIPNYMKTSTFHNMNYKNYRALDNLKISVNKYDTF